MKTITKRNAVKGLEVKVDEAGNSIFVASNNNTYSIIKGKISAVRNSERKWENVDTFFYDEPEMLETLGDDLDDLCMVYTDVLESKLSESMKERANQDVTLKSGEIIKMAEFMTAKSGTTIHIADGERVFRIFKIQDNWNNESLFIVPENVSEINENYRKYAEEQKNKEEAPF